MKSTILNPALCGLLSLSCAGAALAQQAATPESPVRVRNYHVKTLLRNGSPVSSSVGSPFRPKVSQGASGGTAQCSSPHLSYFDGPVVSNPRVIPVYWNSDVNSNVTQHLPTFLGEFVTSPIIDSISEYSTSGIAGSTNQVIAHGSVGTAVTLTPSHCPAGTVTSCTLSDTQIQSEIQAQVNSNVLPTPVLDALGNPNTIYAISFPPKVHVNGPSGAGSSCVQFCAYHNTGTFGNLPMLYAVLMDTFTSACSTGCGPTALGSMTSVALHEITETITDADIGLDVQNAYANPAGWGDNSNNCGEVSDICDDGATHDFTFGSDTWNIQGFWSNKYGKCLLSDTNTVTTLTQPAVTWTTPAAIDFPTPLSATQLNAFTASIPGTFNYGPPSGTVLAAGDWTLNTLFRPMDSTTYAFSTAMTTIHVNKGTPPITWATPSPITYPAPLSATQLDASSTVGGAFVYNPPVNTVLPPGPQTLGVTFNPTDTANYSSTTSSVNIQVNGGVTASGWGVGFGTQTFAVTGSGRNRLPWQVSTISVTFSGTVTATAASLQGVTASGVTGVGTGTLTWTLSSPISLGSASLSLAVTGPNAVRDNLLNPIVAGGTGGLSQSIKVLWGDFNDDGAVNTSDATLINLARSQSYNQFADMNGDGIVNATDVTLARARLGTALP